MIKRFEILILGGLLFIIFAVTFNWALKGAIHYQKNVLVPDLIGKSLAEALELASKQNLGIKKEGEEFNDRFPIGTILRQSPQPGLTVREGKVIRLTLSQGGETAFVPELVGQTLRSAEILLRSSQLHLGEIRAQPSIRYSKDVVIEQEPFPRKIVPKGTSVQITISEGAPEDGSLLMPDFSGKSWKEVKEWSKEFGIDVTYTEDSNYIADSEMVLNQEIPPDMPVDKTKSIKFVISSVRAGGTGTASTQATVPKFYYEVPQGEEAKQYLFVLVDSFGSREIWRGKLQPGIKHTIPLPTKTSPNARVRVFVNGILTEERSIY